MKSYEDLTEKELRIQLAASYRLIEELGWSFLIFGHLTVRVPGPDKHFLINPYGLMYDEVTASNLVKIDLDEKIENGDFEKFENFFWKREILFADLESTPGLFLINLTISWLEKGKNSSETISYYIYAPEAESVSRKIN